MPAPAPLQHAPRASVRNAARIIAGQPVWTCAGAVELGCVVRYGKRRATVTRIIGRWWASSVARYRHHGPSVGLIVYLRENDAPVGHQYVRAAG